MKNLMPIFKSMPKGSSQFLDTNYKGVYFVAKLIHPSVECFAQDFPTISVRGLNYGNSFSICRGYNTVVVSHCYSQRSIQVWEDKEIENDLIKFMLSCIIDGVEKYKAEQTEQTELRELRELLEAQKFDKVIELIKGFN